MSQRRIDQLPMPRARFRLDRQWSKFETAFDAREEDRVRAERLRRSARKFGPNRRQRAKRLAARLDPTLHPKTPKTLASSRYLRKQRIRVFGALWQLVDHAELRSFTVIKRKWQVDASDLRRLDPKRVLSAFRSDLIRLGAAEADGWLFAAYHSEFHPASASFQGHIHGIATGALADLVDRLRHQPSYRSARTTGADSPVVDPVWISRQPLTDLPATLSYTLKSYWPEHEEGPGRGYDRRIREPEHSRVLLWLDRQSLTDITLLMRLSIGKEGLKVVKKRTRMT